MNPNRCAHVGRVLPVVLMVLGTLVPGVMAQANVTGQWSTLSYTMPINPPHAALLNNGKVLIVAGSGNCPPSESGCPSGAPYGPLNNSGAALWDPVAGTITQFSLSWDMFCNGMVVLPDGRVFINGGTIQYDPFLGAKTSAVFDPATNTFTNVQNMAHGRWYPTVTTLGDGRVMTFSGQDENGNNNSAVEIYTVNSGWSTQYLAPWIPPNYPRMHLLPNGKVFYSGAGTSSGWSGTSSAFFDPATNSWTLNVATTNYSGVRTYGTSVLLPLTPANNYDPKIMIMGGDSPATKTTEIIDLGASSPKWVWGPNMSEARIEMNAVILPNGKVLALGGSVNDEDTGTLSLNADLYDPANNTFTSAGANASQRLYHSVALLLPDATVWLAGGNPTRGTYNNTMEVYKPAYLFNSSGGAAARPTISNAPSSISWSNAFTVQTPNAANISSVVLVRNGAVTHAFNMDQRLVGMSFTVGSGSLTVTAPPNGNIAPPGYYMLFLLNSAGVPSVANLVRLGPQGAVPGVPTNLTATGGSGQVGLSWSASSGASSYNVKRSTTNGGPYTTIASPTTTSYTDTGVTNGTTYYYVVSAVNSAGESANSSQVSATPQGAVPGVPTNLTATGGSGQVRLSWSASSGASSYNVKRSTTNGGPYTTIASPTTTSYTDTGVTNGTTYYYVVSAVNSAGESANSSQVSATPATSQINYSSGFTASGLQLNGGATLNGTRLRLTDGGANEARSAFFTTPVNVQSFTTNFSFQATSATADGMTFVIQNNTATAVGTSGGDLGYSGIGKSVAVKFDIYSNAGEGTDSTGLYTGGATPTLPAVDMTSSGVSLLSGDVMNVQLSYNGTTLTMNITDASNPAKTFTTSWTINIPTTVGGNTALVGFTGGTGGLTAIQEVVSWTYSTGSNTNPPGVPTNLTATGGSGQVGLSWSASSGASSYNVKRSTTNGGPYTTIASPTTTSYTDTGVTNGTTYYYVVSAVNSAGESANSSQVSATPQGAVPGVPTNLTATGGSGQVRLSWSASSGASSYNVKRSTTNGGPYTTIASPTTTSYTDTGVTNGTTYYYVVSAVNSAGESANSSQVSATPQGAVPGVPTNLTATGGSGQVRLSWSASSGASSYNVKRSTTNGGPYTTIASPTTTSYTDTGVTNGTTYYYVVSAVNSAGESANSSQVSATPATSQINYSSGFTASGLQLNGGATLNGTRLRLTDGGANEARSAFFTTPVNVQSFTTNFSFQATSATADGMTFVIQNNTATAVGTSGGDLGYSGIGKSVAVKFDIYSNAGEGTDSTGLYTGGATPTLPAVDMTSSGVSLLSGDVMNVQLSYNGTTLTMNITDASNPAKTFTTSWTINIPTTVGGNTALVGFTGGTGGLTATQEVLSWTYSTGSNTNPPGVPTNLTATGGSGQVGLSWSASSGASSYNVKRSTTNGGPYTTIASPTTTSYTDTGVTNGTTYYYVVSAVNSAGESANSSQVSATPQGAVPGVPTNLTATGGSGQVRLSWSASSGASSYNVKRSTTNGGPYTTIASPTTTSYTDTGVTNGTTYYYVVSAVNSAGESANSSQVSATPQGAVPGVPTNLTATGGSGQVRLSWSASSGASSYNVKRSTTNGGPYTTIASPTTTSYTDTGVTNGTTYYYVVSAVNSAGESANSSQVSATPATSQINYSSGFTASGLQLNGGATLNGTRLRLTDGGANEARSAFFTTPVNVQSFTTNFSFQATSATADGMTFVIQNNTATAVGTSGGDLGYSGIGKSVAVKFDIYSNAGEGTDSTGLYTGGATPTLPAVDMTSSGVSLLSGDVMNVQLSYNGTTLTMNITDASNPAKTFTTSWTINIPTTVGGNTALVGFTGGTGGLTATQEVLSWTY